MTNNMNTIWIDRDSGTYFTRQPWAVDTHAWASEDWETWDNLSDEERIEYASGYCYIPVLAPPSVWAGNRSAR